MLNEKFDQLVEEKKSSQIQAPEQMTALDQLGEMQKKGQRQIPGQMTAVCFGFIYRFRSTPSRTASGAKAGKG